MKEPTLKIDRVYRKAPAVKGLDVNKHTKILIKNEITGKVELTKDEQRKAKQILAENKDSFGFIALREDRTDSFIDITESTPTTSLTIKRGVAVKYDSGLAIDCCVEPHFIYDEYFFITDNSYVYGRLALGNDGKTRAHILFDPVKIGETVELGTMGVLSSHNIAESLLFTTKQFNTFFADLDFSRKQESENGL